MQLNSCIQRTEQFTTICFAVRRGKRDKCVLLNEQWSFSLAFSQASREEEQLTHLVHFHYQDSHFISQEQQLEEKLAYLADFHIISCNQTIALFGFAVPSSFFSLEVILKDNINCMDLLPCKNVCFLKEFNLHNLRSKRNQN